MNNPIDITYFLERVSNGFKSIIDSYVKIVISLFYTGLFMFWMLPKPGYNDFASVHFDAGLSLMLGKTLLFIVIGILMLYIFGAPLDASFVERKLYDAGMKDKSGNTPRLMRRYYEQGLEVLVFYSQGFPLKVWEDASELLETIFNAYYVKAAYTQDREHIAVYLSKHSIPERIALDEKHDGMMLDRIKLGESTTGTVIWNIEKFPHLLVGGATNSGKTILLVNILKQLVDQIDIVVIADKKNGIDYPDFNDIATDEDTLIRKLSWAVNQMHERQTLLENYGYRNISDYNKDHSNTYPRIVFAMDEVAEFLDKTGASKEEKDKIDQVIQLLSSLARLGRATNISLILSTQRPDANVLPGQIKAQITYRVAGRCDNVLSQIILDSTDAASKIPHDERGLFLNNEGVIFRGYYTPDERERRAESYDG